MAALIVCLLVPIWWGSDGQYPWDVDNVAPGPTLRAISDRFAPGWHTQYGPMPYFLTAVPYIPILVLMRATGELGTPSSRYPWGFDHPEASMTALVVTARLVTLLLAVGIVLMLARARSGDGRGLSRTWLVPLLVLGSPVFVYYARTSNPEVHYLFWLWLGSHLASGGASGAWRLPLAAAAAALAVATKDMAIGPAVGVVAFATLSAARAVARDGASRVVRTAAVPFAAALAYGLAWQLPWNLSGWRAHFDYVTNAGVDPRRFELGLSGVISIATHYARELPLALGWPAVLGLTVAIVLRRRPARLAAASSACLLYLPSMLAIGYLRPRFLLPLLLVAWPVAIEGLEAGLERLRPFRVASRMAVIGLLVLTVIGGPRLSLAMLEDPRLEVERWLRKRVVPGATVEIGGSPRFQARVPRGLTMIHTVDDTLRSRPRGPIGDVVLVSSVDRYGFEWDPVLRAAWWGPLVESGPDARYERRAVFGPAKWTLGLNRLPVAPTLEVYVRRSSAH